MTAWLGSLGAMVPVGPMARLAPDSSRARTFTPTVGGGMTSRQAVRSFRKWSAATSAARTPDQLANLAAFEVGGYGAGPWWLVDEWAQVTNVLCPWDSELMTPWLSTVSGGPQWLGGDVYAGRSLLVTDPAVTCYAVDSTGAYVKVPVLPSAPLVASAWVNTTGMKVGLAFYTAAGGFLSVIESASTVTGWSRVATLGTAPATAGYAIPYVKGAAGRLARPCVTWTDALMEHSTGHGGIVVVDGYGLDVTSAHTAYRGRMAQAAVSFVEVGL